MSKLSGRQLVPIWLVWELRDGQYQIRAIDTAEDLAKRHKLALQNEEETFERGSKFWIERTVLDHLYGWDCLQKLYGIEVRENV